MPALASKPDGKLNIQSKMEDFQSRILDLNLSTENEEQLFKLLYVELSIDAHKSTESNVSRDIETIYESVKLELAVFKMQANYQIQLKADEVKNTLTRWIQEYNSISSRNEAQQKLLDLLTQLQLILTSTSRNLEHNEYQFMKTSQNRWRFISINDLVNHNKYLQISKKCYELLLKFVTSSGAELNYEIFSSLKRDTYLGELGFFERLELRQGRLAIQLTPHDIDSLSQLPVNHTKTIGNYTFTHTTKGNDPNTTIITIAPN